MLASHLVVLVRLGAHGLFICWNRYWTSPVDELWKHLNATSADYIETNLRLRAKALQKTVLRPSHRDIQTQDALLTFRASLQ